jgi:hypothetical protein
MVSKQKDKNIGFLESKQRVNLIFAEGAWLSAQKFSASIWANHVWDPKLLPETHPAHLCHIK